MSVLIDLFFKFAVSLGAFAVVIGIPAGMLVMYRRWRGNKRAQWANLLFGIGAELLFVTLVLQGGQMLGLFGKETTPGRTLTALLLSAGFVISLLGALLLQGKQPREGTTSEN